MSARVLLIEDDARVSELVARYLDREGITALTAENGRNGLALAASQRPDLVLLDVQLPDVDGWAILRRLRDGEEYQPAVIMLTARSDEPDRVLGLELGADDYIVKPFSPREVVARVKAVLRRTTPHSRTTGVLEYPGLHIDEAGRAVWRSEQQVVLTPKEFDLLLVLARQPGRVQHRMALYEHVWGDDGQGDDHTLDVHINRLRRKLTAGDGMNYITTVKGIGFKFEVTHDLA